MKRLLFIVTAATAFTRCWVVGLLQSMPFSRRPCSRSSRAYASVMMASSPTVDKLLSLIEPTERGVTATLEQRGEINRLIEELEDGWRGSSALEGANRGRLLRECEVKYVGQTSSVRANAAGGRFRGRVGRLVFATTGLYQHVLEVGMDRFIAVNMICFNFMGIIPGATILRGDVDVLGTSAIAALEAKYNTTLTSNVVSATFDSPRVALGRIARGKGGLLNLKVGPPSAVQLDTTYLDDRIRISRGASRGVPFVFAATRVPEAGLWRSIHERSPLSARAAGRCLLVAGIFLAVGVRSWLSAKAALATFALAAGLKLSLSTGGIVVEETEGDVAVSPSSGVL